MADDVTYLGYLVAFAIGAGVGTGELVARYKDAPLRALTTPAALLYVLVNALASLSALILIKTFNWDFGLDPEDQRALAATRMLVAGFGSMALFRSSFFMVRVGSSDVAVGPNSFLVIILAAADRAVDRHRASDRADSIGRIMEGVSFAKAKIALPLTCFALLQNVPTEEQQRVVQEIKDLTDADVTDSVKGLALGLTLMNVVGEDALTSAVDALGDEIR